MSQKNMQVLLANRPSGWVQERDFQIVETDLPVLREGEVLVKNLYLSLDPYMRGCMNAGKSYAAGVFAGDFWRLLRARQRKKLEVTQYHSITSIGYFGVVIGASVGFLLVGQATPAVFTALGLAALVGWLGQNTIGYFYKIVPFLVWSERYGPLVGTQKVPLMRELVQERWAWASWWLLNGSLPVMIGAALAQQVIVLQVASGALALGLCLVLANLLRTVFHLRAGSWSQSV